MSTSVTTAHDANVDRGVAFLDARLGRDVWLPRIKLATLDVSSSNACVACQATEVPWYGDALESIGITLDDMIADCVGSWTQRYGFGLRLNDEDEQPRDFAGLTDVWHRRITELRAAL